MTQATEWRRVQTCCDYEISQHGEVRRGARVLKPQQRSGYLYVTLCGRGYRLNAAVHRLVAAEFCGYGEEVNHANGIKTDNRANNLEWVSRRENQLHAADLGLKPTGERSHLCTKLTESDIRCIRDLRSQGQSQSAIGQIFSVSQTHVGKICRREKWRQVQ